MKHHRKPLFKHNEMDRAYKRHSLFAFTSVIPQIIIIAIVFGCYYYIHLKGYFPHWITFMTYGVKAIIALEILIAAAKSLIVPLLAIALGGVNLYLIQNAQIETISNNDSWQLIIMGIIGIIFTFMVRSYKR